MATPPPPARISIGEWAIDTATGEMSRGDRRVRLEPKPMAVLLYLVEHAGELVSKEELFDHVWTDAVVGDKALVRCIVGLRKAFGDDPQQPQYIETLHRRGYRLIAPVGVDPAAATDSGGSPAQAPSPTVPATRRGWRHFGWIGALAGVLVVAILGTLAARHPDSEENAWTEFTGPEPTVPSLTAVASFENRTDQPRLGSLGTVFRIGLEQSPNLGVIPPSQVKQVLTRMERAPDAAIDRRVGVELCRREGADLLILGEAALIGGVFSLSAVAVDPRTDRTVATAEARADREAELLPTLDLLLTQLRHGLGEETVDPVAPLERVTTPHLAALEAYSLGREVWGRGHFEDAATYYRSALEIDPDFAMARIALGLAYLSAERPEGRGEVERALATADRLPPFEQIYGRAWLAMVDQDYPEMLRLWELLATLFPENAVGEYNLGLVRGTYGGEADFAAAAMSRAARRLGPAFNLRPALFELRRGRIDAALALVRPEAARPSRGLTGYEVLIHLAAGRPQAARERLERPELWHGEDRAWAWFFFHLDRGEPEAALAALDGVQPARPGSYSHLHEQVARIQAQHQAGDREAGRIAATAQQVIAHADDIAALGNSPVPLIVVLGTHAARAGQIAVARQLLDKAEGLAGGQAPTHLALVDALAGEVEAAQGRHREAIARYRASLERVDTLAALEGLARSYRALGQRDRAQALLEDLVARRAQAFGECFELRYYCSGLEANILRWHEARDELEKSTDPISNRDLDWS